MSPTRSMFRPVCGCRACTDFDGRHGNGRPRPIPCMGARLDLRQRRRAAVLPIFVIGKIGLVTGGGAGSENPSQQANA